MALDAKQNEVKETAAALLKIIRELIAELQRVPHPTTAVNLDSSFDRDIGLDSLSRMELVSRIERHLGVTLPERVLVEAETPRDLLSAVLRASVSGRRQRLAELSEISLAEAEDLPHSASTLIDVLHWHLSVNPDRPHLRLYSEEGEGGVITYRQLWQGAERMAAGLQRLDLQPGEPVALMLQASREYFYSFFGTLLAGGIPVPIYPPARPSQVEDHLRRHGGILGNCRAVTLVTEKAAKPVAQLLKSQVETLRHIVTAEELCSDSALLARPLVGPEDIAFLQYTSGSTGNPKGVVLSHANLLANIRAMGTRVQASSRDVFVSWLPLYHDMGLIGAWLGSMYYAAFFVVMSPLSFLARPQSWLWAIHRCRGTLSAAPNFGYELCLRRIEDRDLEGLDLSSWRAAFNGAEAVSPDTVRQFCDRFDRYGFQAEAMMPVYGLAESSVGLSFPVPGRGPILDSVRREPLMRHGRAIPATEKDQNALQFVACGQPLDGHQIRIVDQAGRELPDRQEGHLQFQGPSVTSGYYHNAEETRRLFRKDWLDSGDLAYIAEGEVYITGRTKDIIIRAGRNIYPHELEEAVGNLEGIRAGRVTAFGSGDPESGTERLVVLAETREKGEQPRELLRARVNAVVTDLVGAPPDDVVLAPPGTVLKTSSGKVRRAASREIYESGRIGRPQRAVWWQIARLALAGVVPRLQRARRMVNAGLYGAYGRALFWLLAPPVWLLVVLLPRFSWRWAAMRGGARALARGSATPVALFGLENLPPPEKPCVYVANHASYLDGPLLVGFLPRRFSFVAKGELLKDSVARLFLQRIRSDFVERFDVHKGVEDFQRLAGKARSGRNYLFFPEGTFTRRPGLLPLHMGAFVAAAEAGVPVVPIAIRGTRSILRNRSWLPRRGSIQIHVGQPIEPPPTGAAGTDAWSAAVTLRDAARAHILKHCGEPDLIQEKPPA